MSKLRDLIEELCPDGVEYRELKDISIMKRGTSLTKAEAIDGHIPVISGGKEPAFYCDRYNRTGENITVAGSGVGAGYVQYWNTPIFANDSFTVTGISNVLTKFLYYFLNSIQDKVYSTKKGGGVPHVHISDIEKFLIPIPPMPIQQEIVRILDNFTELKAELEAELKARKKQYEYYRNKLLSFEGDESVKWIKLGDIGRVAMCKRIMKDETNTIGGIPFYKIGTFGNTPDAYISEEKFLEYKKKYAYPKKGDILISASGTIGRTVIFDGSPSYYQDSNIVWLEHDETIVLNSYLRHCYSLNPWFVQSGGTIARLYNENIMKAVIPVPPLSVQHSIVSTLDRFDTLCYDPSIGLPAEIATRKKQYEYYRDKLLAFKEKKHAYL